MDASLGSIALCLCELAAGLQGSAADQRLLGPHVANLLKADCLSCSTSAARNTLMQQCACKVAHKTKDDPLAVSAFLVEGNTPTLQLVSTA